MEGEIYGLKVRGIMGNTGGGVRSTARPCEVPTSNHVIDGFWEKVVSLATFGLEEYLSDQRLLLRRQIMFMPLLMHIFTICAIRDAYMEKVKVVALLLISVSICLFC